MKPDREKIRGLIVPNIDIPDKKRGRPNNKDKFRGKLDSGEFEEFTYKDWILYFEYKYSLQGRKYISSPTKDSSIIKSVMSKFSPEEIKTMIDYVFDSNQTVVDPRTVGIWILSKNWLNTIYNNSILWKEGSIKKTKKCESKNRKESDSDVYL